MSDILWSGWKHIPLDKKILGNTIIKGKDFWKKEYTYILIPPGYGYDNYCFMLSSNCFHYHNGSECFSLHSDMTIELFYNPDSKEPNKKYKRYTLTSLELYKTVFMPYEKAKEERELKREKTKKGVCICGKYNGNNSLYDIYKYQKQTVFKAFFKENRCYYNQNFDKVINVECVFEIANKMSRYDFNRLEDFMNKYIFKYQCYLSQLEALKKTDPGIPSLLKKQNRIIKEYEEIVETIKTYLINKVNEEISKCQ